MRKGANKGKHRSNGSSGEKQRTANFEIKFKVFLDVTRGPRRFSRSQLSSFPFFRSSDAPRAFLLSVRLYARLRRVLDNEDRKFADVSDARLPRSASRGSLVELATSRSIELTPRIDVRRLKLRFPLDENAKEPSTLVASLCQMQSRIIFTHEFRHQLQLNNIFP